MLFSSWRFGYDISFFEYKYRAGGGKANAGNVQTV